MRGALLVLLAAGVVSLFGGVVMLGLAQTMPPRSLVWYVTLSQSAAFFVLAVLIGIAGMIESEYSVVVHG